MNKNIQLIDLPTFPKGVVSLSLLSVASCFSANYHVAIDDLNIIGLEGYSPKLKHALMYGLKVSAQNSTIAIQLSQQLRVQFPNAKIVWGGELPTLLPEFCFPYADTIVGGLFESVAEQFTRDLAAGNLQQRYFGANEAAVVKAEPEFEYLSDLNQYAQFMGLPLETSRGCTEKCIFCMVHTMQKKNYNLNAITSLAQHLHCYKGSFINVIDYNFGVDAEHVIQVSKLIQNSGTLGWMAEMCIELLDNDTMLAAMRDSNCKMIYCGLESIDQQSLRSVHKMNTNHIENYERIIRKVQSYGIQIAAGIILGMEGTHSGTFKELFAFYHRMGIVYAKLTFLTYNPGTKVHEYERKKGVFLTEEISCYDGNQLTFLPQDVDAEIVRRGADWFIRNYFSLWGIVTRSFQTQLSLLQRAEFILFNICYRQVYLDWLAYDTLNRPKQIQVLVTQRYKKSRMVRLAEKLLQWVRKTQIKG